MRMGMIAFLKCMTGGGDPGYLRVVLYHKSVLQGDPGAKTRLHPLLADTPLPNPFRKSFKREKETVFV
jgi:hypothetical protein